MCSGMRTPWPRMLLRPCRRCPVQIYYGDSYREDKDPEHLPPTTSWQRMGNHLRNFYRILGSGGV